MRRLDDSWLKGDWVSLAATAFFELTKQTLDRCLGWEEMKSIHARKNEFETVDISYTKGNKEFELDFDLLFQSGQIDGKIYLEMLEDIFYGYPDIDCEAIIAQFHQMMDDYFAKRNHQFDDP